MKKIFLRAFIFVATWGAGCTELTSCTSAPQMNPSAPIQHVETPKGKCALVEETLQLQNQKVDLPAVGLFTLESHLLTDKDPGSVSSITDRIAVHISRSCAELQNFDSSITCAKAYISKWVNQWTPAEGGHIGEGSVSKKPSVQEEMWSGNMYWTAATKPKPGTRFIAQYQEKAVVVIVGYETGPRNPKFLGGLQGEVLFALRATDESPITWGRAVDQTLSPGPVVCQ